MLNQKTEAVLNVCKRLVKSVLEIMMPTRIRARTIFRTFQTGALLRLGVEFILFFAQRLWTVQHFTRKELYRLPDADRDPGRIISFDRLKTSPAPSQWN